MKANKNKAYVCIIYKIVYLLQDMYSPLLSMLYDILKGTIFWNGSQIWHVFKKMCRLSLKSKTKSYVKRTYLM